MRKVVLSRSCVACHQHHLNLNLRTTSVHPFVHYKQENRPYSGSIASAEGSIRERRPRLALPACFVYSIDQSSKLFGGWQARDWAVALFGPRMCEPYSRLDIGQHTPFNQSPSQKASGDAPPVVPAIAGRPLAPSSAST